MNGEHGCRPVPALRAELAALRDDGVEVAEREEDGLELALAGAHLQGILREVVERLVQVREHAGRGLVRDLDRGLEDALRDDVRVTCRGRLS